MTLKSNGLCNFMVVFPWPRSKSVIQHLEHVPSGGNWSIVHALRLQGNIVHTVNLYSEKDQIDEATAVISAKRILEKNAIDAILVFDAGWQKIEWRKLIEEVGVTCKTVYFPGDLPMREDANTESITIGQYTHIVPVQHPYVEIFKHKFPDAVVEWMPYHHDGILHYPVQHEPTYDIIHLGKLYGLREKMLQAFSQAGLSVYCGNAWGHKYRNLLAQARIGWHEAWCGEVGYRHFEIPAMGRMLLCDKLDEKYKLGELYSDGEYVTYEGATEEQKIKDAVEKAKFFVSKPDLVEQVAALGTARSIACHGAGSRASQIVRFCEGSS